MLDEWRNFFSVAHFDAAILVFSVRFGGVFYCFNFGFCSATYVSLLSHLSLLGFFTFVFFTFRCHLFFKLRRHRFFYINSFAFWYFLSFLLRDDASGRNVVNSSALCSTVCCSLNYIIFLRPRWIPKLLLFWALRFIHSRLFCALRWCLLLLQLWLPFNHPRPSVFSPFSTVLCLFRVFHTALSPSFLHNLMRSLILSFIPLTWWILWAKGCQFYCLLFCCLLFFN